MSEKWKRIREIGENAAGKAVVAMANARSTAEDIKRGHQGDANVGVGFDEFDPELVRRLTSEQPPQS